MPCSKALRRQAAIAGGAQGGDRRAGIDMLVPPGEARQGQIEQAVAILIDQAAAILMDVEILRADQDARGADALGRGFQHRRRLRLLRRDHGRRAALEDAGLLACDLGDGVAEIFGMVERDRRHHRAGGMGDDIGRVEATAEPDFEQHDIRRMLGKSSRAAAAVISKKVMASPALMRSQRSSASTSTASSTKRPPPGAPSGCAHGSAPDAARCRHGR
jgi:hypothetical protein